VAEPQGDYRKLNAKHLGQLIAKLEQEMYRHAENLEFEQAAKVRDRIHAVRESALRGEAVDVGVG
jgi:excinuclease ABC subunit B